MIISHEQFDSIFFILFFRDMNNLEKDDEDDESFLYKKT